MVKKYVRKPFYVDAELVTRDNIETVSEWCDGEIQTGGKAGRFIKVPVSRPANNRQSEAYVGNWVVLSEEKKGIKSWRVYTQAAFDASFQEAT